MSGPSETQRLAGMLFTKIREVEELTTSLVNKVEEGAFDLVLTTRDIMTVVDKIDKKIDDNWTFISTRFTGLENGRATVYTEVTRLQHDVARVADDVAVLALMIHQLKQLVVTLTLAILVMFFVLICVVPLVPV
jgi:hypothetical protein